MADQKISELTALTGANVADDDAIAIVDTSATETKKIVFSELKNALDTATGFVRITGDTMTGNLSMGDNVKAIFGAGSDLQIYHDGSDSIITDTGTGNLIVKTDGNNIQFEDGSGNDIFKVTPTATNIYHGTSGVKLQTTATGIDVTGTLVSDGLTVDGAAVISNSNFDTLYLRRPSTSSATLIMENSSNNGGSLQADNNGLRLYTRTASSFDQRINLSNNGDISFYEDTGTTAKFFWDASAESLGVGHSSAPTSMLAIGGNANTTAKPTVTVVDTTNGASMTLRGQSPKLSFDITSGGVGKILMDGAGIEFKDGTLDSEGNVDLKIDSSGNLLVGMTSANTNNDGVGLRSDGLIHGKRAGVVATFNRKTSDGSVVEISKDNTVAGVIGTSGVDLTIGTGDVGLKFNDASNRIDPWNVTTNASVDGTFDLGKTDRRFKDLYLSGGVVFGDAGGSGTSSSNTLDSYEEGTWTPAVSNMTVTGTLTTAGRYTKVGRMVSLMGWISATTSIAHGVSALISGFPFAGAFVTGESQSRSAGVIVAGANSDLPSSNHSAACFVDSANSRAFLGNFTTTAANEYIYINVVYYTA